MGWQHRLEPRGAIHNLHRLAVHIVLLIRDDDAGPAAPLLTADTRRLADVEDVSSLDLKSAQNGFLLFALCFNFLTVCPSPPPLASLDQFHAGGGFFSIPGILSCLSRRCCIRSLFRRGHGSAEGEGIRVAGPAGLRRLQPAPPASIRFSSGTFPGLQAFRA